MKYGLASGEFLSSFEKLEDRGRGDEFDWKKNLCHGKGLRTEEDKRAFRTFTAVMTASKPEELNGISVEQLLSCWERRADFEVAFIEGTSARIFAQMGEKIKKIRTVRRRRIL